MFELNDLHWNMFEEKFSMPKTDVTEVNNIFRHICRLYVANSDLELWNSKTKNVEIYIYETRTEKDKNLGWHKFMTKF